MDFQLAGVELINRQVPVDQGVLIGSQAPLVVVVVGEGPVPVNVPHQGVVVARGHGRDVPTHLSRPVVEVTGPTPLAVLLGLEGQS